MAHLKVSADNGNHFASYHLGKIYADPESNYFNLDKAVAHLLYVEYLKIEARKAEKK